MGRSKQWRCHALCLIFGMLMVSCLQMKQLPMSHCRNRLAGVGREMYCSHQMLLLVRGGCCSRQISASMLLLMCLLQRYCCCCVVP